MNNRPVLFLDSGIGGIPYCRHFCGRNPDERVVYLADRRNFPYGARSRGELIDILTGLVETLIRRCDPKTTVLACNTAAVSALAALRERFPALPFVGTVPAVKPAALASKTGKVGVLGTERTIGDPYIRKLAAENGGCEITGIAAPELVEFVERRFETAGADEKREIVLSYIDRFRAAGVDALVLGCTHFLFLLEEFRREAAPDIAVFESVEGITRRIESLLGNRRAARTNLPAPENLLLLTGSAPPEARWREWARRLGLTLTLLDESLFFPCFRHYAE
jgi:glutamate racemase